MTTLSLDQDSSHGQIRVDPSLKSEWSGHLPATQLWMLSILGRTATGSGNFTADERALYTLCEFWAAAAGRELNAHLRSGGMQRLRCLIPVFNCVGAVDATRILAHAHRDLAGNLTSGYRQRRIKELEEQLVNSIDPIDQQIAVLANALNSLQASA